MGRRLLLLVGAAALALRWPLLLPLGARAAAWLALRLLQIAVLVAGSGAVWWALRALQLAREQDLLDQALRRYNYYSRYRHRASSAGGGAGGDGMADAGFQLRVLKRLPVAAHLRTAWGLPPELCDEIGALARLVVRDYVSYWFRPISPASDDFPHDVRFLLADLLGAAASRITEIDSSQALTMIAKCIELCRMHLGWFREAYAQLAEDFPDVFDPSDADDASLARRQEYVLAYVQQSQFVHPACVKPTPAADTASPTAAKKAGTPAAAAESAEALYLRHFATQLLVQLKPQLDQQYDTNIFVSIATNLLREITAFKILKPLTEYAQPRYANELVVACLGAFIDDKDGAGLGPQSPTPGSRPSLNKLRMTGSFLYKASKRSSEQAEAAFQALVDAVSSAATTATGAAEGMFEGDEWADAAAFTFGSSVLSALAPSSGGSAGDRKTITSMFSLDERISLPKAPRLIAPRNFMASTSSSSSHKNGDGSARPSMHLDDLKNVKANIGSSLNSSIGKVKKRFRTFSSNPNEHGLSTSQPPHSSSSISGALSNNAAARMIRKPGQLLQKAWKRNESTVSSSISPNAASGVGESFDDLLTPPSTPDGEMRHRSNARAADEAFDDEEEEDEEEFEDGDEEDQGVVEEEDQSVAVLASSHSSASDHRGSDVSTTTHTATTIANVQDRVVRLLDKTVVSYVKMFRERQEMRSSARARELYELLSALEDVLMLGYRARGPSHSTGSRHTSDESERVSESTVMMVTEDDLVQSPAHRSRLSSSCLLDADHGADDVYYYWNYLAQDRPDAPVLNDHWRFIATNCPPCCDSDSFVSTRGIQWLLVALEKGQLSEFFAGLHLHDDVTRRFYDDFAILSDAKRFDSVLSSLRQLNSLKSSLEIPALLGRKSAMDQEFGVSPISSRQQPGGSSSGVIRVLESVWETERYVPIQGWVKAQDKRKQELPSSEWVWEGDWALENQTHDVSSPGDSSDSEHDGESGENDKRRSSSGSWEYAKTFEDKFHDKEKKFDSVRRRRWIRARRQLPPVLSMSSSFSPLSPSLSRGAASPSSDAPSGDSTGRRTGSGPMNGWSKARRLKNRLDVFARDQADKIERATKLRPMVKRRSFSFDKNCPASPISTSALEALNVDLNGFNPSSSSGGGSTPVTLDSGSNSSKLPVPLRRRSSSGRVQKAKTPTTTDSRGSLGSAVGLSREFSSRMSGYEEDLEDDDLCFRCLKSLTAKAGSAGICQSCHQRVCAACHNFFAFAVFPPPLESTKKARMCGNCYDRLVSKYKLRIEAHVGKYLIKEKEKEKEREVPDLFGTSGDAASSSGSTANGSPAVSPSSSAASGTSSNARFEITVRVKGESAYAWTAVKTFHDFEVLEKKLFEKLRKQEKKHGAGCRQCHWKGVDYMELLTVEPSLRNLPIAALTYEKRLYVLEEFLQSLLSCDTLCQSAVIQKFLLLSSASGGSSVGGGGGKGANAGRDGNEATASSGARTVEGGVPSGVSSPTSGGGNTPTGSGSNAPTGALLVENGKWKKGRWIAPDANSKETKMRVLQKLEVSLFAVLGEVFEFDGIGTVRRHLFSVTRSFIKAFLSASHFRKLERQVLSFTEPGQLAAGVRSLREYMFPADPAAYVAPPAELPEHEMHALRAKCLEALVASFPPRLVSLMGDSACENAALKVHGFLQHEVFVKNLLFSLADELLLHLFPDATVYKFRKPSAASASTSAAHATHSAPPSPTQRAPLSDPKA